MGVLLLLPLAWAACFPGAVELTLQVEDSKAGWGLLYLLWLQAGGGRRQKRGNV